MIMIRWMYPCIYVATALSGAAALQTGDIHPLTKPSALLNFNGASEKVDGYFKVVGASDGSEARRSTVLEAPVRQDGIKLFIAIDGDSFEESERPGNGGLRLLNYPSDDHAIDDAVRLAEGMTRKHDMFRTGFSGAKLVAKSDINLDSICRKSLMEDTASALETLGGSVYTGCDLNTSDNDMDYLTKATKNKYVLAGRNSKIDTNVATAASVIGSILGLCDAHNADLKELTFTVQGCGKVGSIVAKELVQYGVKRVQTCDLYSEAANIDGCHQIDDWTKTPCDFLVPCANSLAITEDIANNFPEGIKFCTGATNSPFASLEAKAAFAARGVSHVPESISSAGAILADSVEWYDISLYQSVAPTLMYGWVRSLSQKKSHSMAELAGLQASRMGAVDVTPSRSGDPIGQGFPQWIKENTKKTQTLIVGGGMAGTSTAFGLGQKGVSSILLEQGPSIAPPSASSNGDSRMYRQMYSNEFFSKMQATALDRWRDVEKITGEKLLQQNGLLFYGEDTGETVEGSVLGAKQTMDNLNLKHTFYSTGDEIAEAYPSLSGCKGQPYSGVCEDTAGHIKASKACEALIKTAGDSCEVHLNAKVVSLDIIDGKNDDNEDSSKRVVAITEDGKTILADNVVLAAGPWTNSLLEMLQLPKMNLKIWEVQWAHYRVKTSVAKSIPQAFHFRKGKTEEDGGLYYVFPESSTESLTKNDEYTYVKVGVDFPSGTDLENMESFDYKGSQKVQDLMDEWVAEHLPDVEERVDSYASPYTMTDDSYFIMDKLCDDVAVFSGGSGRAFKFAPLIGDCMAALIMGDEAPIELERFSAKREVILETTTSLEEAAVLA